MRHNRAASKAANGERQGPRFGPQDDERGGQTKPNFEIKIATLAWICRRRTLGLLGCIAAKNPTSNEKRGKRGIAAQHD